MNRKRIFKFLSSMLSLCLVVSLFISVSFAAVTSKTLTKYSGDLGNGISLNITCTYSTDGSRVLDVSSVSSNITGTTGNYTWKQNSYTVTRLDGGRTAAVKVTGTLTQYVYVNGQTKTYSSTKTGYAEFCK